MPKQSSRKSPQAQLRSEAFILGIEGGGTKTTWALVTLQGKTAAEGKEDASNFLSYGIQQLERVLRSIRKKLGVRANQVMGVGGAFAGCHTSREARIIETVLRRVWPKAKKIRAGEDIHSLMAGAFGQKDGIGVIAGTGSNVFGRAHGKWDRAGGWEHLFADAGSGFDIARRGLEAVYNYYDETLQVSILGKLFLKASKQSNLPALCSWLMEHFGFRAKQLAQYAPLVFEAAAKGDRDAQSVLRSGAEALGRRVGWLAKRLQLKNPGVVMEGSLLQKEPGYRRMFEQEVLRHVPQARPFLNTVPGALGAAMMVAPELHRL